MKMDDVEYILIIVLIIVNLVAGFGCAFPIGKLLGRINSKPNKNFRYLLILIGIYFLECVAFSAGMATQFFSIGLAFVWGIIFGLWLRSRTTAHEALKMSFFIALYTSLPTVSIIVVPLLGLFGGWKVLSAEEGARFGIPAVLHLPWPLNTILGFFGAIAIATVVFKTVITTGEVSLLIHLGERSAGRPRGKS